MKKIKLPFRLRVLIPMNAVCLVGLTVSLYYSGPGWISILNAFISGMLFAAIPYTAILNNSWFTNEMLLLSNESLRATNKRLTEQATP